MLNAVLEIIKNPFSFVFQYFIGSFSILGILASSVMLSILVIPFYFLGNAIYSHQNGSNFKKGVFTAFIISIISTVFIAVWSLILNPVYTGPGNIFSIISGIVTLTIILSLLIKLGTKINEFMQSRWEMPPLLQKYLIILICCTVVFTVWAIYLFVSNSIL